MRSFLVIILREVIRGCPPTHDVIKTIFVVSRAVCWHIFIVASVEEIRNKEGMV